MDQPKKKKIGFVGLGIMGSAMAQNCHKSGFQVVVNNRSKDKNEVFKKLGIETVESPVQLVEKSDAIVVMVTDAQAVKDVLSGPNGILSGPVKNKTLIQMSTIDVGSTMNFFLESGSKGMPYLDCPVTGSKKQVEEGQLIILAGGEEAEIEKWNDFFMAVGKTVVRAGEVGKGSALKLCMNLIVAQMTTALCESLALAHVQELDARKIFEVIAASPALNCGYFKIKESVLLNEDFSPAFSLENMLKDVRFINEAAKAARLPLPVTQAVKFLMEGAVAEGFGKEDLTSIAKILKPKHLNRSN